MIRCALPALLLISTTAGEPVSAARSYLGTALDLLQTHSAESAKADWPRLRAEVHRDAAHARHAADTYPVIKRVIAKLGNPHTALLTSPGGGAPTSVRTVPGGHMIGLTADVKLPPTSPDDGEVYVDSGRRLLLGLAAARPRSWVVDLRGNSGGDMHPMLTVVAPLLGEGRTGMVVHADGSTTDWGVREGHVFNGERVWFPQVKMPAMPAAETGPVAVLADGQTASSGEAVLISFVGAQNSRSFGEPTAGYATSNEVFELPDGARLAITTALMADRTGRTYGNAPIAPHTLVDSGDALSTAIEWLTEQT